MSRLESLYKQEHGKRVQYASVGIASEAYGSRVCLCVVCVVCACVLCCVVCVCVCVCDILQHAFL